MKKDFYSSSRLSFILVTMILAIAACSKPMVLDKQNDTKAILQISSLRTVTTPSIIQWQKCFGSSDYDDGYSIAVANDLANPGYFLAGYTIGNNGNVTVNHGGHDAWIIKTGLDGTLKWQIAIGGTGLDEARGVVATDDGGCIVAINTNSSDGDVTGLGYHGSGDLLLVKLNNSGAIVWKKIIGGSKGDMPNAMIKTADGGVAITGYTLSQDGDLSGISLADINQSVWLVKLNPDPLNPSQSYIITMQNTFGIGSGTHGETGYSIVQTSDGNYTIAGATYSGTNSNPDIWVVNANGSGIQNWTKKIGGIYPDVAFGVASSPTNDGIVITGFTSSSDLVTLKLDNSGQQILWQTTFAGGKSGGIRGQAIISTSQGYIITGSTSSNSGDIISTHGGEDLLILQLNLNGNKVNSYTLGGSGADRGRSLIQTTDGMYIVTGYTNSNNGDVFGNHGLSDVWLVKFKF